MLLEKRLDCSSESAVMEWFVFCKPFPVSRGQRRIQRREGRGGGERKLRGRRSASISSTHGADPPAQRCIDHGCFRSALVAALYVPSRELLPLFLPMAW